MIGESNGGSRKHRGERRKLLIQRVVDPRPEQKVQSEQLEYFLINQDLSNVSVNGQLLGPKAVAGPLPAFSVIEVEAEVIFWWRDEFALNFDPSKPAGTQASAF